MSKSTINMDDLNSLPPDAVAKNAYRIVSLLQRMPPHMQCAAIAAVLLTVCNAFKVRPSDLFLPVGNLMSDPIAGDRPQFRALRLYVKGDIADVA